MVINLIVGLYIPITKIPYQVGWPSEYEEFRPWHIFGNVFGLKGSFKTSDALWYFHVGIVVEKKRYSTERHGQNIKPPCKLMFFFEGNLFQFVTFFCCPRPPSKQKKGYIASGGPNWVAFSHQLIIFIIISIIIIRQKIHSYLLSNYCLLYIILCHGLRNLALLDAVCMFSCPSTWLHFVSHGGSFTPSEIEQLEG